MKDEGPRDLTPEEIEDLRRDRRETHEWFLENYPKICGTKQSFQEHLSRPESNPGPQEAELIINKS